MRSRVEWSLLASDWKSAGEKKPFICEDTFQKKYKFLKIIKKGAVYYLKMELCQGNFKSLHYINVHNMKHVLK